MYNPVIRTCAAVLFLAAFLIVAFSAFKTAKIIKESIGEMVRNDADVKKAAAILKRALTGKVKKGDAGEMVKAVFGLSETKERLSGRGDPDLDAL